MRKHKFHLDRKSLDIIYTSFIRPILEYVDVAWCNLAKYQEDEHIFESKNLLYKMQASINKPMLCVSVGHFIQKMTGTSCTGDARETNPIAQLVERLLSEREVVGSNHVIIVWQPYQRCKKWY